MGYDKKQLSDRFFSLVKVKHDVAHHLPYMQRFKNDKKNTIPYQILQLQQLLVITTVLEEKINSSEDPIYFSFKKNKKLLQRSLNIKNDILYLQNKLRENPDNKFAGIVLAKTDEYVEYLQLLEPVKLIAHFYTITQASMFGGGLFRNLILTALDARKEFSRDGVTYYFTQHQVTLSESESSDPTIVQSTTETVKLNSLHVIKMLNAIAPESESNIKLTARDEVILNTEGNVSFDWFIAIYSDLERWCVGNTAQFYPTDYQPQVPPSSETPRITNLLTSRTSFNCLFWGLAATAAAATLSAAATYAAASMGP